MTDAARFRGRSVWRNKSIEIRTRDKGLCQHCKPMGKYAFNIEVHHIVKLEDDMRLGLVNTNLISLCKACHVMADSGQIEVKVLQDIAAQQEKG
ncbi:HNH endonuclease [Paenibacillus sp. OV219]|uniref:HNH endonuclease n=1 Tax=Paenibacillus sp. OV219 TaxID=1884377 RepID=UPI000B85C2C2